jgi:hypothetical protein
MHENLERIPGRDSPRISVTEAGVQVSPDDIFVSGSDQASGRPLRRLRVLSFPFATDPGKTEGTEFELVAEPTEDRSLISRESTCQIIGPFSLGLEVDQVIG